MAWIVLAASGCMECVWAVELGKPKAFSQPLSTIIFVVVCPLSMLGLVMPRKRFRWAYRMLCGWEQAPRSLWATAWSMAMSPPRS